MSIAYIENIFSDQELNSLHEIINRTTIPTLDNEDYISFEENMGTGICRGLGRIQISNIFKDETENICTDEISTSLKERVLEIASNLSEINLSLDHGLYSEYSNKYGSPNLPPHFDGDTNDLIINFQLSSNTSWDVGVGVNRYSLVDNSAVVFNGNTNIHWRPIKTFKDGEYIKLIFFRFYNSEIKSDYSYVPMNQIDPAFVEAIKFRDSLTE